MQGEGEARSDEADSGGEAGGVVEPYGDEAEQADDEGNDADALARPEGGLLLSATEGVGEGAQDFADEKQDEEKDDGEEELVRVLGV